MLKQVAEGVLTHQSEFMQTNAVVVQGQDGVLLIDAGIRNDEMVCLAKDLSEMGQTVVAGFSTHPHWDHLLWHSSLGQAPRHGTASCAATVRERLPDAAAKARVAGSGLIPPDIAEEIRLDLLGVITALPDGATRIPWDGPEVRIIEHQAHAPGHASLLIEERRVLVAADTLSDILVPLLNLMSAADPIEDYLAALGLLEGVTNKVDFFIPGHGSVGDAAELKTRIAKDRAYLHALRDGSEVDDPRIAGPFAPGVHERQAQQLGQPGQAGA
jgi:glyoxylase-like metal-dependent hydrolase (beta-lactamase superfamily II)